MPEFRHDGKLYYTPVEFAWDRIGGTWKMPILWRLKDRVMRYSELKRSMPRISDKMLASQLRELEHHGLIAREVFAEVPPRVEYRITESGQRAVAVIETLRDWGLELMREAGLVE
jgi:DNA-binding HxlR family transcriptional regulator